MLKLLEIELELPPNEKINISMGSVMHGVLMEMLPPNFARLFIVTKSFEKLLNIIAFAAFVLCLLISPGTFQTFPLNSPVVETQSEFVELSACRRYR